MPFFETVTPISRISWIRLLTSKMSGMLSTVTSSAVSNVAQIICKTSFWRLADEFPRLADVLLRLQMKPLIEF